MSSNNKNILVKLSNAVIEMDEELVKKLSNEVLEKKLDVQNAIINGLAKGMREVGDLFEKEIYSIPEVLLCADALEKGLNILKPHLTSDKESSTKMKIIIGTVEGDIHSIGKNMVKMMFEVGGFEVVDLGEDVTADQILKEIDKNGGDIVALSTMMSPTLESMRKIIEDIRKVNKNKIKIMVGGASVTKTTAEKFKSDGYAENAPEAVNDAIRLSKLITDKKVN